MADNGNIILDGLYLLAKAGTNIKAKAKEYIMAIIGPITSTGGVSSWNDLTDKPTEFPPEDHTHVIADITDYVAGNLSDGDYGDIIVSSSGSIFTIDNGVVSETKLTLSDNTTLDVTTSRHGFVPKAPNDTTKFLRGDGTWTTLPISSVLLALTINSIALQVFDFGSSTIIIAG